MNWQHISRFRLLLLIGLLFIPVTTLSAAQTRQDNFVRRTGASLHINREPFRFAGSNNYYLMYKSPFMVDDVLETAASQNFTVMRTWGFLDIGNQDGSGSTHGIQEGIYFHYWDGAGPAYNDGPDGLEKLDYVIYKAGQEGIKLVIPLTNNWSAFGGMDQYVRWIDGTYHDEFYTHPQLRSYYKDWVEHLLTRTNIYTGVQYKDDPAIMTWELANEPRCKGSGLYPPSPDCTTETLVEWADEMSTFIKSIDQNHLVSVGDEGFYCDPLATDWTQNCGEGVDTLALSALPNIDVMSFHLYPDHWLKDAAWGTAWIEQHLADARQLNKPVMLGEFGLLDKSIRNPVYFEWTNTFMKNGGTGALYWILSGEQDDGTLYPDYDGFTVYCDSPVCTTLHNFSEMMFERQPMFFAPVADHDTAVTEFETAVSLTPAANDIAYTTTSLDASKIDLDPGTPGQQTSVSVTGGSYALQPDGSVLFSPDTGFSGKAEASYIIRDNRGRISNVANLSVNVKPSPSAPIVLFSFESGVEGWAPGNWQTNAGTVAQSDTFHTDGSYSLQVDTADGGWFGLDFAAPVDLSGKTALNLDIQTTGAGTSTSVALKLGDSYTWCQSPWGFINAGTTTTLEVDMLTLGCDSPELDDVRGIFVWVSGSDTFYLDYVRAE